MTPELNKLIYAVNGLNDIARGYESLREKTAFTAIIGGDTMSKIETDTIHKLVRFLIQMLKDLGVDATTFENPSIYGQPGPNQKANENTNATHAETSTPLLGQPSAPASPSKPVPPEIAALQKRRRLLW